MTEDRRPRDADQADNQSGSGDGESKSADRLPAAPAEDDAPIGDTDQHSTADA
jgi:hypothetical protein